MSSLPAGLFDAASLPKCQPPASDHCTWDAAEAIGTSLALA